MAQQVVPDHEKITSRAQNGKQATCELLACTQVKWGTTFADGFQGYWEKYYQLMGQNQIGGGRK